MKIGWGKPHALRTLATSVCPVRGNAFILRARVAIVCRVQGLPCPRFTYLSLCLTMIAVSLVLAAAYCTAAFARAPRDYDVQIVSFAPARAFAVGTETVTMVGVLKNIGSAAAPSVSVRMLALAGLEYIEGDTAPVLMPLEAGAQVTLRWKVRPTNASSPLVASLAVLPADVPPVVRVITVPHFADSPRSDTSPAAASPSARARGAEGTVENDRLRARLDTTSSGAPMLFLSARGPGGWRRVGTVAPLAEVLSAEGGQEPWWELFRADDANAVIEKDTASLVVSGSFGLRWRATLTLTVRTASAALDVSLKLAGKRPLRLSGVRLAALSAGDLQCAGSGISSESGAVCRSAVKCGDATLGAVWSGAAPLENWQTAALEPTLETEYLLFGPEWRAERAPALLGAGAMVVFQSRLFAICPSATVQDCMRIFPLRASAKP